MQDEVTASPIDIARAYMGRRTSELGPGSYNVASKSERPLYKGVDIHSNQFIPPTSPKASPCWPGAMVQEQRGYTTPLSQRGTFRSLNFPRTPYSRTSNSKSKANVCVHLLVLTFHIFYLHVGYNNLDLLLTISSLDFNLRAA